MRHPFQCLLACPSHENQQDELLVAASGPYIYTYSLHDGRSITSWPQSSMFPSPSNPDGPPPEKKPKLSKTTVENVDQSTKDSKSTHRLGNQTFSALPFSQLVTTRKGQHVVAITDEGKCIRVFAVMHDGQLNFLSERFLPKRPCAIAVTEDDATIICGDKFGDVYALPLLTSSTDHVENLSAQKGLHDLPHKKEKKLSAEITNVHTARNRQARENQLRQSQAPEENSMEFSYDLLLGHISMITDLALATLSQESSSGSLPRNYIITSDRDEHIRISRGMPQSHVIEAYCLGHTQFVSKICLPKGRPDLLISGGGDDFLCVWDWVSGNALHKVGLRGVFTDFLNANAFFPHVTTTEDEKMEALDEQDEDREKSLEGNTADAATATTPTDPTSQRPKDDSTGQIAVSGIWALTYVSRYNPSEGKSVKVLVAFERVPALFAFHLSPDNSLAHDQTLVLKGNALSVAVFESKATIIVSIDSVHMPGPAPKIRGFPTSPDILLQSFTLNEDTSAGQVWHEDGTFAQQLRAINEHGSFELDASQVSQMHNLLYTIEDLRKRGIED